MTLARARALVERCGPDDQRDRILAFLEAHPDALHRSCPDGHLTASALVVDATGDRALLMHHRKLDKWLQMGGHAEGDADLAAVALKEAFEESGIDGLTLANRGTPVDLDVHEVRPPHEPPHLHLDVRFVAVAPAGCVATGNDESHEVRWVDLDDLARTHDEPGMRRLAAAARSLLR
ncbi:MAG TPA: NUDIX hydrolase [Acidimicrobiales bacterium]|nr:NUDIX hydrolase [Acidimicrobiales bacterium]